MNAHQKLLKKCKKGKTKNKKTGKKSKIQYLLKLISGLARDFFCKIIVFFCLK